MEGYTLLETISHDAFKEFAKDQLAKKGIYKKVYHAVLLISCGLLAAAAGFGAVLYFVEREASYLVQILLGLIFSLTLLIVIHELLHAAAYKLAGAKNVYFGAVLSKFVFFAGSDKEVFNGSRYKFIALFPFLCITICSLTGMIVWPEYLTFFITLVCIHTLFCGGDFAILNYIQQFDPRRIHTSDSREKKETYFFLKD